MNTIRESNSIANPIGVPDPVKAIENDREFKAYIYQQLVDLQPFLEPESQISVLVQLEQDEASENGMTIILSLVATIGDYKLEAEGRHGDMYEAFSLAKQAMVHELEEYYNAAVDATERDAEIQTLLAGGYTIH